MPINRTLQSLYKWSKGKLIIMIYFSFLAHLSTKILWSPVVRRPLCVHQHLLLTTMWANLEETSQKALTQWLYNNSFKLLGSMQNVGVNGNTMKITLKFFFSQTNWQIFKQFCRNAPWMTLYQIPSSHVDWLKNIASRGRGYFALYGI